MEPGLRRAGKGGGTGEEMNSVRLRYVYKVVIFKYLCFHGLGICFTISEVLLEIICEIGVQNKEILL